jgi:hypothetical protein
VLAELEVLYQLGDRGHVDFVDDNLIGNEKALKIFLPELAAWLKARDYPFEFSTEALINMADDDELLRLVQEANFFTIFPWHRKPRSKDLGPRQEEVEHKAQSGRERPPDLSRRHVRDRGLHRELRQRRDFDGRRNGGLHRVSRHSGPHGGVALYAAEYSAYAATGRCRAAESRPRHGSTRPERPVHTEPEFRHPAALNEILLDYRRILERIYDPSAFADRLERVSGELDRSGRPRELPEGDVRRKAGSIEMAHRIITRLPDAREPFWQTFVTCVKWNPAALRYMLALMAFYPHLGPFARQVIAAIDVRLAELDLAVRAGNRRTRALVAAGAGGDV